MIWITNRHVEMKYSRYISDQYQDYKENTAIGDKYNIVLISMNRRNVKEEENTNNILRWIHDRQDIVKGKAP